MAAYDRSDDLVISLQQATILFSHGRYDLIASADGDVEAAQRVTEVADVFVAWLRRGLSITLTLVSIEEQDTGEEVPFTPGGTVTTIDTSQQARYVISSADDRGFPVDATLQATSSDEAVATVELFEATTGTASGKDELLVKAVAPGSALITVSDPDNADIFGSDNVDVVAGGVAAVVLETPTVEEQEVTPPPVP